MVTERTDYLLYIDRILGASKLLGNDHRGRTVVSADFPWGFLQCRFTKKDGIWLNCCDYSVNKPFCCTVYPPPTPRDVWEQFFSYDLRYDLLQVACKSYGQTLIKPKELEDIKKVCSVRFCKLLSQVYILGNDLYVFHNEYFCPKMPTDPKDIGTSLHYRAEKYLGIEKSQQFVYSDSWGDILLHNIAWCKFSGFMWLFRFLRTYEIARVMRDMTFAYHGFQTKSGGAQEWCMFYEEICEKIVKKINFCEKDSYSVCP